MRNPAPEILSDEDVRRLGLPLEAATGLPAAAYLEAGFFDLEQDKIFRSTWMAAAFTHDIPDAGDAVPVTVSGVNIIIVRDKEGVVRALHNVCRHRASTVLASPCKGLRSLVCPYHCWTYDLDGKLKRAPYFDGTATGKKKSLDAEKNALVSIRSGVWLDVIFVNLSGTAPPIEEYVKPLAKRFDKYQLDSLTFNRYDSNTLAANWKVVMEGLLEVYHEEFIHRDLSYRMVSEGVPCWEDIIEGEMMGFVSTMPDTGEILPQPLPRLPGMPKTGPAPSEIFLLFPSVTFNVFEDHFVSTIWSLSGAKETSWRSAWYFHPDAGADKSGNDPRDAVHDFWLNVRKEDLAAVLSVQHGMESLARQPHEIQFSPFWEDILHKFQQHILRAMT